MLKEISFLGVIKTIETIIIIIPILDQLNKCLLDITLKKLYNLKCIIYKHYMVYLVNKVRNVQRIL